MARSRTGAAAGREAVTRLHENLVFALRECTARLSGKQWARERRETLQTLGYLIDDVERELQKATASIRAEP